MAEDTWRANALFSDGGCAGGNPSRLAGVWAWCRVEGNQIVACASGHVRASAESPIGNNLAEYIAAVRGLEALPAGWSGYLCSDSQNTLGRLFWRWKLNGIPEDWRERAAAALRRLGRVEPVLLQGHPTRAELECGLGSKRNLPVSKWNKWCDERCQEQAAALVADKGS